MRVCNVRLFAAWALKHGVPLTLASHEAVASYLAEQLTSVRQVTARSRLHALRSWFAFCQAQGWRQDDPTAGIRIKLPHCQPKRPFTLEELRALLGVCLNSRDRAIVLVLAATGMRVSELLGMEARDVDWQEGTVLIRGKGNRERRVALGGIALEALRQQVNGERGPIWHVVAGPTLGRPMTRVLVRDMLRLLGKRTGVAPVGSHRFRTTFANFFLCEAGGDVGALQVLMGHQNIAQTLHYAGWTAASRALEQQRRMGFVDRLEA
jgi:site-specific recombinase XerD